MQELNIKPKRNMNTGISLKVRMKPYEYKNKKEVQTKPYGCRNER